MSPLYALAAFAMTLAGGAFAWRYQRYLNTIMAFSAGLLVGVVFLDLMPEIAFLATRSAIDLRHLMIAVIGGFVGIFLLEKLTIIHGEKGHDAPGHRHHIGFAGAVGLSFHSFLDGLAIGVGFQAGREVGLIVLMAVLAHDFADGLNTVAFMLHAGNPRWKTVTLLIVDAAAPVIGAATASVITIAPRLLAYQLSFFCGFLLYLGASDLLPHVHIRPSFKLIASTLLGLVTAGLVVFVLEASHPY